MSENAEVGARIAATRTARRLTQRQLAEQAHLGLSLLRKVEQGSRSATDRTLDALASALGVQPDSLLGRRVRTSSRVHDAIPAMRTAIDAYDLPEDGPVRPMVCLRQAVEETTWQRLSSHYTRLAENVPPLLAELARATQHPDDGVVREAATLLTVAYRSADAVAYKYGYYDLSARLIELMRWAASRAEDPALDATAAYVRTEVFFSSGNLAPGLRALEAALDAMPPFKSAAVTAAAGALHMRAAVLAARLTGDSDSADEHMANARRLAVDVPEGIYTGTAFGPASVHVHEISVAVELGNAARAVDIATRPIDLGALPAERRSHHHIEVARAQLWLGLRDEALASLQTARRIAPQHVREHPHVRQALLTLLRLHVSPPQALVAYAEWARAI
ncbi:helix-turn-helix transcriptional regulator [Actinomadura barringtoniae]|uniref:Helix-turn-helix transcriptional regulator n=1 Tax=Actinomadura barringtoniae TaxID=1427535 RepID=A0A939TBP4_9ACTN|nr:helix-turn-helix transcriptional regulator [Actinomadura barringtoniae]MBO2453757.1 helix-turn-helix transcriptional regulator [Actinomadura barringtoniae]